MSQYLQITTTAGTRESAQVIADSLVGRRLVACAQVYGPITSTYWWQEKKETTDEWLCVAKTRAELYTQVEAAIRELHTYQVPEIVAVPIIGGLAAYLEWITAETRRP
jgi:periplasmic divalent cation tolerance protein